MTTPNVLLISIDETRQTHRIVKELSTLSRTYRVEFLGRETCAGGRLAGVWRGARWLAAHLRAFDVVHIHELASLVLLPVILALRRPGTRIVYEEREYARLLLRSSFPWSTKLELGLLYYGVRSWARRFFDAVVVISDEMRDLEWKGRARVVRNYPDLKFFERIAPNGRLDPARTYIVHHGTLVREKGVMRIPELLARLGREDVHALVIGDLAEHGLEPEFHALAAAHGVASRIVCTGRLPLTETIAWLKNDARMIAAILADDAGQMSRTVFVKAYEYLYLGIPMVATDCIRDFVDTLVPVGAGLAVAPGDPAAHADAARRLIDEHAQFRAACLAARDRFSWESQAAILAAVYESLV